MEKLRSKILHLFASLLLVTSTVFFSQQAIASPPDKEDIGPAMVGDLIFARPIGLIATVAGTAVFVVSLPFTLLGGNAAEAANALVVEPAKFTFVRPLGK